MDRVIKRKFAPIVLEQLEQRLAPASSIFEDQITNIYRFALNRSPESGGLQAHVRNLESGKSLGQVANAIFSSDEHQRSLISSYYQVFLNRDPDPAGLNSLVRAAQKGATSEEILATFLSSPEYNGEVSNESYVDFLYQQVLARAGDETGRAAHLRSLENGASRFDVALAFLTSAENDSTEVSALYSNILGRVPNFSEVEGWVNLLASPQVDLQDSVVAFLSSPEGTQRLGNDIVFGSDPTNFAWYMDDVGQHSLTVRTYGSQDTGKSIVQKLANQIRAVETFSNPDNIGQIKDQLVKNDYPNDNKLNDKGALTTGTFGASAYSLDARNTPGAFQVDLANIGKVNPYNNFVEVFGQWDGTAGATKDPKSKDVEIAFTQDTLSTFLGVEVDAGGLITRATRSAAAVLLHSESLALDEAFDPANNPLIGRHIDSLKREQLSLYLAGRLGDEGTVKMADDRRVAPGGVVSAALDLQYQTSKSYMYGVLKTYADHDSYKAIFEKARALFGSTMKITSSQTAFGIKKGEVFWSRFNAGFITGGAYVSGMNSMFGLYSGLVQADEEGQGTWTVNGSTVTFTKVADGGTGASKVFMVDKTPVNLSDTFPSIFHYGAVLSPYAIDPYISDPASWGVTGRKGELGYGRLASTETQQGGGVLNIGSGAVSYVYKGLEDEQTITVTGSGFIDMSPVPAASADSITVDNSGYNNDQNNSQTLNVGQKIDMSAYKTTIEEVYKNLFYVDTSVTPFRVAHISDAAFQAPAWGLYLNYVHGADGSLETAAKAIREYLVTWQEPYKYSYRVGLKDTSILGYPSSAAEIDKHFVIDPPPPPVQGSGALDASLLTGALYLRTDTSISRVLLGTGSASVVSGSQGDGIVYVLNKNLVPDTTNISFSNLRFGTDKVDLTGFGTIANLAAKVTASFDNNVTASQLAKLYPRFTNTVEVSFSAGGKDYKFLVLASGSTQSESSRLVDSVLSSVIHS